MSGKRDIDHIQSHTEYVRSHRTCRRCGTSVPAASGRAPEELCEKCSVAHAT
ncbi:hypothetical protein [Haloarcula sp. 1CSR25-25]|uniref:hypothetical protein n=1 Tax=Haloarcula sp. 1CSR25-25 TaxID=2862545 RepID=UPI0028A09474|nr:hypothetical protein [Haloarcula sp. 1CSR25-25]